MTAPARATGEPLISVVLAVRGVEEYLPGCLDSILRPPGYRRPPGLRGLKTALICHDAYRAYALLAPVNNARMIARRALPGAG